MNLFKATPLTLLLTLIAAFPTTSIEADEKPLNIILFLVDDWGWTDGGVFGSDLYQTPNMDKLAREGTLFSQAYAACTVCSPTRSAVLTGLYPARTYLTDWIGGHAPNYSNLPLQEPEWTKKLEFKHTTIAEVLKQNGYRTASIGKWHLTPKGKPGSPEVAAYWPEHHGFDKNIGGNQFGSPGSYFAPYGKGDGIRLNMPESKKGDYITDRLVDEAVELIENWKDDPFFFYFPLYNVHLPLQAKDEYIALYQDKVKPGMRHTNAKYAAMVHAVDVAIGRVSDALEAAGLSENTMIILTGDNGGLIRGGLTSNAPLREGKGSVYEGGVRVPCVVKLPGGAQGARNETPIISNDFFPTILSAAGIQNIVNDTDGQDLTPILSGASETIADRDLFWHYPHYHTQGSTPYSAIRSGDYRLIEYHRDGNVELYNLANDIGECNDLSRHQPHIVNKLKQKLHAWRDSVSAQMPTPHPDYDPTKPTLNPSQTKKLKSKK
ncbi:sulfatase [Pelagicoccus mobilis]|uniref:Sulfatase n=1 Tax=Pelagicoccus mobilis TaxID=415221 RepID=A0A934RPU5_9BACT|nr:sulfatase [Pelagicoccus mobilis]MBK1875260.1 sulfatase [Pelagicoccus mobilis]